jgi:hypothetical protein
MFVRATTNSTGQMAAGTYPPEDIGLPVGTQGRLPAATHADGL